MARRFLVQHWLHFPCELSSCRDCLDDMPSTVTLRSRYAVRNYASLSH